MDAGVYLECLHGEIGSSGAAQVRRRIEKLQGISYFNSRERIQKITEVQGSWGNRVFH